MPKLGAYCVGDGEVLRVLEEFREKESIERQREPRWSHPFPARMPLSLAEHSITKLTAPEAVILDPMMGAGTTLIGARRLGRPSLGFDRDPLAYLLSRCATQSYRSDRLEILRTRLLKKANESLARDRVHRGLALHLLPKEDRDFIEYWFPRSSQKQLFSLVDAISQESDPDEKNLAWLVFSSLIIAKSAGASFALDMPRSRPHKRLDKTVIAPFDGWHRRFTTTVRTLPFVDPEQPLVRCETATGDARKLPLGEAKVDFVLTSPPYLTAVDYLRGHKFSLIWMGHRLAALRELRGTMIGTERGLWKLDGLPSGIETKLGRGIDKPRRKAQVRRYLSDLKKTLRECYRVLCPGGLAVLVVGPSIIDRYRCDAAEILSDLAISVNLNAVATIIRPLDDSRRSLPPPDIHGETPLDMRMRSEVIVALRK